MVMWFANLSEGECVEHLAHFVVDAPINNILRFETLLYTTKDFHDWWNLISLEKYGSTKAISFRLEDTFSLMQQKFEQGMDPSILEGVQIIKIFFFFLLLSSPVA